MKNRYGVTMVVWGLLVTALVMPVSSETFQDEIDQEADAFQEFFKESRQEFFGESVGELKAFKDERDQEFAAFLKEAWEAFEIRVPETPLKKPKPTQIPVAPPAPKPAPKPPAKPVVKKPGPHVAPHVKPDLKPEPVPEPVVPPTPPRPPVVVKAPAPAPVIPPPVTTPPSVTPPSPEVLPAKPPVAKPGGKLARVDYFDLELKFYHDPALGNIRVANMGNRAIGRAWEKMAQSDFSPLMAQLAGTKKELHLNDWGYFLLLHGLAHEIFPGGGNERHVLIWFLMNKSGYDTKIGYRNEKPLLLVAVSERVFGVPFLSQNGKRYYLLSPNGPAQNTGNVYTYKRNYPGAEHPMSFRMADYPGLKTHLDARVLKFKFQGKAHSVKVLFNKKSIPYFQYYPQTQADIYASAAVPGWLGTTLLDALEPLVKNLPEQEAANLLLCFVQTSFDYKTDQQQFGREKYLFPEETIFYPYSDCEDRSILFSYLVKQLLGLDVVLLSYSDHMATAVRFKRAVNGDRVQWGNEVYTVCDPTYINASIGMAMPQYKGRAPEVLKIF